MIIDQIIARAVPSILPSFPPGGGGIEEMQTQIDIRLCIHIYKTKHGQVPQQKIYTEIHADTDLTQNRQADTHNTQHRHRRSDEQEKHPATTNTHLIPGEKQVAGETTTHTQAPKHANTKKGQKGRRGYGTKRGNDITLLKHQKEKQTTRAGFQYDLKRVQFFRNIFNLVELQCSCTPSA